GAIGATHREVGKPGQMGPQVPADQAVDTGDADLHALAVSVPQLTRDLGEGTQQFLDLLHGQALGVVGRVVVDFRFLDVPFGEVFAVIEISIVHAHSEIQTAVL